MRFQNFQHKSLLIQGGEDRTLGKFCDPLVSKYDICLIIQEHRLVDFFFLYLQSLEGNLVLKYWNNMRRRVTIVLNVLIMANNFVGLK